MSALWMSTLTEAAVRTTALLGVAATVAFLLRHRAAATRHLVWVLALGGALVLPLAGAALPRMMVPVPQAIADALPVPATSAETALSARSPRKNRRRSRHGRADPVVMDAPDPELRRAVIEALSEWSSRTGGPEIAPPPPPPPPPPAAPAPDPAPAPDAPDA